MLVCKSFLKNKEIEDILVFGSFVKGKEEARDIDLCFVFSSYNDELIKKAYEKFEKNNINTHITKTKFSNLLEDPGLWNTLIHEGFSIKNGKNLSVILNLNPYFLFEYNLKSLDKIKKQIFSHALYGTGGRENFLKGINGLKLGRNVIIIPLEKSEKMRAFLETWNIVYKVRRIWL